ncbi:hypothetical protein RS75_20370 [Rhizobium nepotum 39/7]|uniref:Transmembrane protein n=1 Tax=Rhizobium nepotum 39/7 TaxID=1368418 RepID=A0ABR5CME9_9HYPH|nr:hypothetical protein RS75_20370 [Rhizobium nepotum 39/7]
MKQVLLWTAGGLSLAIAFGLAGLHHLSASVFTLTVFCAWPAVLFHVVTWCFAQIWSLPDRIAAWIERPGSYTVGGKGTSAE